MGEVVYLASRKNQLNTVLEEVGAAPVYEIYMSVSKNVWEFTCLKNAELEEQLKDFEYENTLLSNELQDVIDMSFWERLFKWPYKKNERTVR